MRNTGASVLLRTGVRQLTLTWLEIDARWPGASVLWDRDVAPGLTCDLILRDCDGMLWADDEECSAKRWMHCVCHVWIDEEWICHHAWQQRQYALDAQRLAATHVDPSPWWDTQIDEASHVSNDTIDALMYGARHMWNSSLPRSVPRWPMLRRILGRNTPVT